MESLAYDYFMAELGFPQDVSCAIDRINKDKNTGSAETLRVTALPAFYAEASFDFKILSKYRTMSLLT